MTIRKILDEHPADEVLWFGTVTPSGRPTTRPVWFVHHDGELLLFSEPGAAKVRHLAGNPHVVVTFPSDPAAAHVRVVSGTAVGEHGLPSAFPGYLAKYERHYDAVGYDRDRFDATFDALVRITPERTWGW